MNTKMKLYEVPRNSVVRLVPESTTDEQVATPPDSRDLVHGQYLIFSHVDGMYSFCYDTDGNVVHPAAFTEVEVIPKTYENHGLIRTVIKRGGRGKDGTQPLTWVPIKDMNDQWLDSCITYVRERNGNPEIYENERRFRKEHGISIPEDVAGEAD